MGLIYNVLPHLFDSVVNYDCSSHLTTGAAADQQQAAATDQHRSSHAYNRLSVCPIFSSHY